MCSSLFYAVSTGTRRTAAPLVHRFGWWAAGLFAVQLFVGAINVWLMAPVWLQMVHLLLTMVIWMLIVLYGATVLAAGDAAAQGSQPARPAAGARPAAPQA